MNAAREWAARHAQIESERPKQFSSSPSDTGRITARVNDHGQLCVTVERMPAESEWRRFARWILTTIGEEP